MVNKEIEFLIPWSVVAVAMEDLQNMFGFENETDATLVIRKLDEKLQQTMDSFSFIRLGKLAGIKRLVAGYVVHDHTIYFTVTCDGEEVQKRLDKRFKLVATNETH